MPSKKTNTAPESTSTDIVPGLEQYPADVAALLQQELVETVARTGDPATPIIKIGKGGETFEVPGLGTRPADLDVVVIGAINRKEYYKGRFNRDNPKPPVCFAFGDMRHNDMSPHEGSSEPQCDTCAACELNVFEVGSPKECKDAIWLCVLPPDNPDDNIALVRISPTGLSSWRAHVNKVKAQFNLPPIGVITRLRSQPAGKSDAFTFRCDLTDSPNPRVPLELLPQFFARKPDTIPFLQRVYNYD